VAEGNRSEALTTRVALKGRPLATGLPGSLQGMDTIVERLDDATFNDRGVATTRVQLRAIQFASIAPIRTACGDYSLEAGASRSPA
jgi:hypothetical protein